MKAIALALGGFALAGSALAQDIEAGRKVANMCRTCHGMQGVAQIPMAPSIAGEPADYLVGQLRAFRAGERTSEMMNIVAGGLSDLQIADVAAWYAAQTATATIDADPAAAPEPCAGCHGADGIAVLDGTPNLAGESALFLRAEIEAFQSGARASEVMGPIAEALSGSEIRAAAEWYAAAELEVSPPE